MENTKIRWTDDSWNPMSGCRELSPGCDKCYAKIIAEKRRGTSAFPNGFEATWRPHKLKEPRRKSPRRYFTNSMSDLHFEDWTIDQVDEVYDAMVDMPQHDYQNLTKRPQRMVRFLMGAKAKKWTPDMPIGGGEIFEDGWLARRGLTEVPPQVWLGTTIELDNYTWRADWLRTIPGMIRFLSCEPLLGPLPSLNLTGLAWVIIGGESGSGSNDFRPMDLSWGEDLVSSCDTAGTACYWKQTSGIRTEMGQEALGYRLEEMPLPPPRVHLGDRVCGVYRDADFD